MGGCGGLPFWIGNQQQTLPYFHNNDSSELWSDRYQHQNQREDPARNFGDIGVAPRFGSRVMFRNPMGGVDEGVIKAIKCSSRNGDIEYVVIEFPYPMGRFFPYQGLLWDESGRFNGLQLCECKPLCGVLLTRRYFDLVKPNLAIIDSEPENKNKYAWSPQEENIIIVPFSSNGLPIVPPICLTPHTKLQGFGIFGKNNSCYMDSLLMSMFAFHTKFDFMLQSATHDQGNNISEQDLMKHKLQDVLRCYIVNPLRMCRFCQSKNVNQLRLLLAPLNARVQGAMMDVEEFALLLFGTLKLQPFLQYVSGLNDFLHQILVFNTIVLPKVVDTQTLFESSMSEQRLEWTVKPSPALFLIMPRNSGSLNYFKGIIPSPSLNIADFVINGNHQCIICGAPANVHCQSCYNHIEDSKLKSKYFCSACISMFHKHPDRESHEYSEFESYVSTTMSHQEFVLHLIAVICIRSSHYVAFLKGGEDSQDWVMYDSDPLGGNPKIKFVPNLMERLVGFQNSPQNLNEWKSLRMNGELKRLITDGYVYIYC